MTVDENTKYIISFPEVLLWDDAIKVDFEIYFVENPQHTTMLIAKDRRMLVVDYGELKLQYEIDEYFLTPQNYSLRISDYEQNLESLIFPKYFDNVIVDVHVKINNVEEFNGRWIPEQTDYDMNKKELQIVFSSNTDIINKTMLIDSNGNKKNPLNLDNSIHKIKEMILKSYQLISSQINLDFSHDWLFEAEYSGQVISNGNWDEFSSYKQQFYIGETLGDALKNIAKATFSITGAISNSKAFFKKLYSQGELITLGKVLEHRKNYRYNKITYSNSLAPDGSVAYEVPDSNAYTNVNGEYVSVKWDWGQRYIVRGGVNYLVSAVNEPSITGNEPQQNIIAKLHYNRRSKLKYNRVDEFVVKSLNVDFAKSFEFENERFQIISLRKNLNNGYSTVLGLYLGAAV